MSERASRTVYYGFEANSGDFVVIYEWSLCWNKKMGKFFTSQEKAKIDNCKKQASRDDEVESASKAETMRVWLDIGDVRY